MGTTTFYLKHNDIGSPFNALTKDDREALSKLSPYGSDNHYKGWSVPMELHNGNIYVLVFWRGRLMRLEDAPKNLNQKYYNRYHGKTLRVYEWTLLYKFILNQMNYLNKLFKKIIRKTCREQLR